MVSDNKITEYDNSVPFKIVSDFAPTGDQPLSLIHI